MLFRILYVFPEPLPLAKARSIQVINTVHALAQAGVAVDFAYVPVRGIPDPFPCYGLLRPQNVRLIPLSRGLPYPLHRLGLHSNKLFLHRLIAWLKQSNNSGLAPQVVMVRHLKLANSLLLHFDDLPVLYEAHEIFADAAPASKKEQVRQMEKAVLFRAKQSIAITGELGRLLRERYELEYDLPVLPSATTLPETLPSKDWAQASQHIVYAGSLYEWKGAQDLVAAAAWLPGCRITLLGGETHRIRELQQTISPNGAEVVFTGHISHAEATSKLAHACIAILPNREGSVSAFTSPLKLFEYMAAGCAIVATDLPVFKEVLGEQDALWVKPGEPTSLASAIATLAQAPALAQRLGENVRRLALSYSWDARAHRLINLFRDMLHES